MAGPPLRTPTSLQPPRGLWAGTCLRGPPTAAWGSAGPRRGQCQGPQEGSWPRVGLAEPRPPACGQREGSTGAWLAARRGLSQRLGGLARGLVQGWAVPRPPTCPRRPAAPGPTERAAAVG